MDLDISTPSEWLVVGLLLISAVMSLAAGVGVVRFPDTLTRLHATAKPQILGLFAISMAILIENFSWSNLATVAVILLLQFATQPVTAHMVGRAAYRAGTFNRSELLRDDLAGALTEKVERAPRAKRPKR